MWKQLADFLSKVFTFMHRLERQEKSLSDQQKEIKELHEMLPAGL